MSLSSPLRRIIPALLSFLLLVAAYPVVVGPAQARSHSVESASPDLTFPLAVGHREVLVSLPEHHDPSVARPVILTFGGWHETPEQMAATTGLREASDAIVVYARGVENAWAGAPYSATSPEEDVAFARDAVREVAARHPVDWSRVYAVGHSNGGAFALLLACRAPDLVAGVVSVAGMFYDPVDAACVGDPVPVQVIHAEDDPVAQVSGGLRHDAHFLSAREMLDRWADRNGCLSVPFSRAGAVPGVTAHEWWGCHAETRSLLSDGGGHGWPPHAAWEAWDFLSRQNR
ncbi:alpha/beta fold hydrolase [Corynebacterium sp.]|uniref:alpha/beta hydrolase family esterase n=1 Tax=Corynebacterium sp. TaxID=1720 RepID=UPI00198DB192|nr:alpha/beta fold hydrolase [Corynebacterium sp.]HHU66595.1 alpha/beta fold hydrolase [Corynebacterium sp.]